MLLLLEKVLRLFGYKVIFYSNRFFYFFIIPIDSLPTPDQISTLIFRAIYIFLKMTKTNLEYEITANTWNQ